MEKLSEPIDMNQLLKEEKSRQEKINKDVPIKMGGRTDLFNML